MPSLNVFISLLGLAVLLLRLKPWMDLQFKSSFWRSNTESIPSSEQPLISIIVPCRNEEDNIGILLESLEQVAYPHKEVLVVDDSSTDSTFRLASAYDSVTVLRAGTKPEIWTGKNWPCHVGAMRARGEILLFTDADTLHAPNSLQKALDFMKSQNADMISAPPFHECRSSWEKWLGLFHLLPLIITNFRGHPKAARLFAIGQYLMFKKKTYWEMGGHKKISNSLVDDIDLAVVCLSEKYTYRVFPYANLYSVQMFANFKSFSSGWTRLIRLGMARTGILVFLEVCLVINSILAVLDFRTYLIGLMCWALIWLSQSRFGNFNAFGILMLPVNILMFTIISLKALGEKLMRRQIIWRNRTYFSILLVCLGVFTLSSLLASSANAAELSLQISKLRNGKGAIAISVFSEQSAHSFPENATEATKTYYIELNGRTSLTAHLGDFPTGVYGIALLHDENGDRQLNSTLGVPREGFGFTNNPTIFFGAPSFYKCSFNIDDKPHEAQIHMKYLL